LENIIFKNKIWPNDPRVGCRSPCNLVNFIEINEKENQLKEFKGEFEQGEI